MTTGSGAVTIVEPFLGDPSEWDRFVEDSPGATFCHLWGWRPLMEEVLGCETLYLAARDGGGAIEGVLPLVEMKSLLTGHFLISLPFLNYGGPVGSPEVQDSLLGEAVEIAQRRGVDLLEMRMRRPLPSSLRVSRRKLTVLLPLPGDPALLWKGFDPKLRSQIRRPMKSGMQFRSGPGELEAFYRVFARTMHDLGTPVLPRRLFEGIRETFSDRVVFGAVYQGETPVAAGCGFRFGDEFELSWAGFLREYGRESPNMLLYWGLMEKTILDGGAVFNFGRCSPDSGTHRFKRQWGGEDLSLPWLHWSPEGREVEKERDSSALRTASLLWRHLPRQLADSFGPLLARRLPWF